MPELYEIKNGTLKLNLHPGQSELWASDARFTFVCAGLQSGKRLSTDTPIPTPNGWKLMRDIIVGDVVYDERGLPCNVVGVPSIQMGDCYKITFDDGASIIADAEHQWLTQTYKQRKNQARQVNTPNPKYKYRPQCRRQPRYTVCTTEEIKETLYVQRGKKTARNHSVDIISPVQYPYRDLPIPPYTFGAWLGDGMSSSAAITCSNKDYDIIEQINREGIKTEKKKSKDRCPNYSLAIAKKGKRASVLRGIGVLNNKHIPDIYLTSSAEQRLELLRGLMDTDGYCGEGKTQCEYTSTKESLAYGALELCRSLGIKARLKVGRATLYGKDCGPKYRIFFTTPTRVFHLDRKAKYQLGCGRPDIFRRFFSSIEPVESVPCKCITVDSPSNLYLAGKDYIVTHNTSILPWVLYKEIFGFGNYPGRGGGDYLACTASFDLFKLKFLPELKKVFCEVLGIGRYWAGSRVIELKSNETGKFLAEKADDEMFARIILRSAQSDGGLESATAKAAILDECGQGTFELDDWIAIQGRLSLYQGRVFGATTLYNLGWMKTEIYDEWANGNPDYNVIQFPSYMNPAFPKDEYDRMEKRLPSYVFSMRYKGMFARPSGMIYKNFSDQFLVDPFDIPSDWQRVIGLDFGGANTCKLWLAENPQDGRWYIYDCSLSGDLTTREHVEHAQYLVKDIEEYILIGGSPSEEQQRIDWIDNGLDVLTPSISNVESGIDRVSELLKTDKIRVFRNLKGFRDEIGRYSRKLDSDGEPTYQILNKRKFHRMDALRYASVYITDCNFEVTTGNLAEMMEKIKTER